MPIGLDLYPQILLRLHSQQPPTLPGSAWTGLYWRQSVTLSPLSPQSLPLCPHRLCKGSPSWTARLRALLEPTGCAATEPRASGKTCCLRREAQATRCEFPFPEIPQVFVASTWVFSLWTPHVVKRWSMDSEGGHQPQMSTSIPACTPMSPPRHSFSTTAAPMVLLSEPHARHFTHVVSNPHDHLMAPCPSHTSTADEEAQSVAQSLEASSDASEA